MDTDDGNHSSDTFDWDLFVVAGNPAVHTGDNAGSDNITQENMFNSPDGLKFDKFEISGFKLMVSTPTTAISPGWVIIKCYSVTHSRVKSADSWLVLKSVR